jgi:hypothetical protein
MWKNFVFNWLYIPSETSVDQKYALKIIMG